MTSVRGNCENGRLSPGASPDIDALDTASAQGFGHRVHSGAGGDDIVDDRHMTGAWVFDDLESIFEVDPTLFGRQTGLRRGRARPYTGVDSKRDAEQARNGPGDFGRLVETALLVAGGVQGNRNQPPRPLRQGGQAFCHQCSEQSGARIMGIEFEGVQQMTHGLLIAKYRPGSIESGRMNLAVAAYERRRSQRSSAAQAAGLMVGERPCTGRAKVSPGHARIAAQEAGRRIKPILYNRQALVQYSRGRQKERGVLRLQELYHNALAATAFGSEFEPTSISPLQGGTASCACLEIRRMRADSVNVQSVSHAVTDIRHDWQLAEVKALFRLPFNDLLYRAQAVHRRHFDANEIQISSLLSIKTGACSEDCAYCPQSARYDTAVKREHLMPLEDVLKAAAQAKAQGASRFCMGAAWRSPKDRDLEQVARMIEGVSSLGLETCVTLGMLTDRQAHRLKEAGLDYYNHNLDTSEAYYAEIITTRTYQDRLDTLRRVRDAGIHVCCGGIVGMGESEDDRAKLLLELAALPQHPESVPINLLVQVAGTPLAGTEKLDPFIFVRTIAVARILMPASRVRLSAGRTAMSDEMQALCFFAGANSIFYGERLLTTENPLVERDRGLFDRLGLRMETLDS